MFYLTETKSFSIMTKQKGQKLVGSTICVVDPKLVFCRSGLRSKAAVQKLFDIRYTNINKFGGLLDWTCEIATDNEMEE